MDPPFGEDQYPLTIEGLSRLQYPVEDAADALNNDSWTNGQTADFCTLIRSRNGYWQLSQDFIPELRLGRDLRSRNWQLTGQHGEDGLGDRTSSMRTLINGARDKQINRNMMPTCMGILEAQRLSRRVL